MRNYNKKNDGKGETLQSINLDIIRISILNIHSIINPSVKRVSCRRFRTVGEILVLLIFGGSTHEIARALRSGDRNAQTPCNPIICVP